MEGKNESDGFLVCHSNLLKIAETCQVPRKVTQYMAAAAADTTKWKKERRTLYERSAYTVFVEKSAL